MQVLDVHVLLGEHDGSVTSPGAVLSTGPITFHSVRQQPQVGRPRVLSYMTWGPPGRLLVKLSSLP